MHRTFLTAVVWCLLAVINFLFASAKPNVLRVPLFVDLVGGYHNAAVMNASALPYPGVRTWEVLAATELAVAAVNEQSAILPQHDIRLEIYDCLFNSAEAAFKVAAAANNHTDRPSMIIAPVMDGTAFMVSVIVSVQWLMKSMHTSSCMSDLRLIYPSGISIGRSSLSRFHQQDWHWRWCHEYHSHFPLSIRERAGRRHGRPSDPAGVYTMRHSPRGISRSQCSSRVSGRVPQACRRQ